MALMAQTDVLFVGGAHIDYRGQLRQPAVPGASNPCSFTSMPGGAALNSASIVATLGSRCQFAGVIGNDNAAIQLLETFKSRKIEPYLLSLEKNTGSYTSILQPDGELYIATADMDIYDELEDEPVLPALL